MTRKERIVKKTRTPLVPIIALGLLAASAVGAMAQEEVDPVAPVAFKGQWGCDEEISPFHRFENGNVASLAKSVAVPVVKINDPRLDGVWTWSHVRSVWGPDAEGPDVDGVPLLGTVETDTYTARLETGEGAWQGGYVEASVAKDSFLRGPLVLVGEGDYAGFTAIMSPHFSRIKKSDCGAWNFRGFIVEGAMPAAPEAAEATLAAE
jgi:hypothetical protein